jgi:hypothetical protein
MRRWFVCIAVCVLAACSGGASDSSSSKARPASTTTTPSPSTRLASSSSTTPDTVASGSCAGALAFSEAAGSWASTKLHTTTDFSVTEFRRSRASMGWARALLVPDDQHFDALWVVARCDATKWVVVDGGTSGVGCGDTVPTDLAVECP